MELNNTKLQMIDGIYDIQPPLIPEAGVLENGVYLISIILILCASAYLFWLTFYSNKAQNKRKIKKLHKIYSEANISSHQAIYQLCIFLRQGLKINKISTNSKLPARIANNKEQWLSFTNKLSDLRYKNSHKSKLNLDEIFHESLYWLRIWK